MSDGLVERIVSYILRGITGLILTGSGYQLFDGRWFGQTIFQAYLEQQSLHLLTAPTSTDLYGAFAFQSVPSAISDANPLLAMLFVLVGLAVLAHVVSKPSIAELSKTIQRPPIPEWPQGLRGGSAPTSTKTKAIVYLKFARAWTVHLWLVVKRLYVKYQPLWTIVIFLALTAAFFKWPFRNGLGLGFLVAALPAALYLVLYPGDLTKGGFLERFGYIGLLVVLVLVLFGWPQRYGRTAFDPDFPIASNVATALDHCDEAQLSKGPSFVAHEKASEQTLFRVCIDKTGDRQYIDFFTTTGSPVSKRGSTKLSAVVKSFVRPGTK